MAFKRSAVRSRLSPPSPEIVRFQDFFSLLQRCVSPLLLLKKWRSWWYQELLNCHQVENCHFLNSFRLASSKLLTLCSSTEFSTLLYGRYVKTIGRKNQQRDPVLQGIHVFRPLHAAVRFLAGWLHRISLRNAHLLRLGTAGRCAMWELWKRWRMEWFLIYFSLNSQ